MTEDNRGSKAPKKQRKRPASEVIEEIDEAAPKFTFRLQKSSLRRPLWIVPSYGSSEADMWEWAPSSAGNVEQSVEEEEISPESESVTSIGTHKPSDDLAVDAPVNNTATTYRRIRYISIFIETFSALYSAAKEFVTTIAEPLSRPLIVHEYRVTSTSLYAAASQGLKSDAIIQTLSTMSKNEISPEIEAYIHSKVDRYGKATLVLQRGVYRIVTKYPEFVDQLKVLLKDTIGDRVEKYEDIEVEEVDEEQQKPSEGQPQNNTASNPDWWSRNTRMVEVHALYVKPDCIAKVRELTMKGDFPLMSEYDFRSDEDLKYIPLQLKEETLHAVRAYQKQSLTKMFGNGRARSGLIVLPCGAGKTCVGVVAACTMKKPTIVFCSCTLAAEQWKNQFQHWANIADKHIMRLTSTSKDKYTAETHLIITTYTMLGFSGHRSKEVASVLQHIRSRIWGLVVLDEVHVVPSDTFRKAVSSIKYHTALGLTATLLREDEKIVDLSYLIGPKLYEANWWELVREGTLARVQCIEVKCPMSRDFYRQYVYAQEESRRRLIYIMNPYKMQACQALLEFHEKRGDKILVFSDDILALMTYARALDRPYVYGGTPMKERVRILTQFQHSSLINTVFISKIGDQAIDLPDASVVIQISAQFGSRRQEAQRLGRILRPKKTLRMGDSLLEALARKEGKTPSSNDRPNAFFYSLVSTATREVYFATKRQQFLLDQGYYFKVIDASTELKQFPSNKPVYATKESCQELLTMLMVYKIEEDQNAQKDVDNDEVRYNSDDDVNAEPKPSNAAPPVKRQKVSMSELSGVGSNIFMEYRVDD